MKSKFSETDVLNLLGGLKNAENNYPSDMISSRRAAYIKQAASMGFAVKAGKNGNGTQATSSAPGAGSIAAPAIGKVLEIALAIVILAEAGVVTYLYRKQISEWINNLISPRIEQGVNPTDDLLSPLASTPDDNTETATATATDTPVVTVTVTNGTPAPFTAPNENSSSETSGTNDQIEATPVPQDNPGNHYGNTPKPDRTKEPSPNNNNDNNNSNNNGNSGNNGKNK